MLEDVSYCRTSLNFWCSLFVIIFCFSCHYFVFSVLSSISAESTIHMNRTFVNLGKTYPDFPNRYYV